MARLVLKPMKSIKALPTQLAVTAILASIIAFTPPVFVNRLAFNRAFMNYIKNPTAENGATLKAERAINERVVLTTHLEVFGLAFVLLNAGWFLFRRRRPQPSENA